VEGLKGITIEKEGYKTLKLKVEDQALLESLRENLERRESLTIEDLHFYLSPFMLMPVPYQIKRLRAGSLKISSPLFSLLHHPEEVIGAFFEKFGGVEKVSYSKSSGSITIRYEPSEFDLIGFINYL
jgi:hypothetical protein